MFTFVCHIPTGKSVIRKGTSEKTSYSDPDILNCFIPSSFWVSWDGNIIKVGRNLLHTNRILEYVDTDSDKFADQVSQVRIGTADGDTGRWAVSKLAGK